MTPPNRCVSRLPALALLLAVGAAVSLAAAAKHSPDQPYQEGIKAFAAEDYAKAAEYFAASMQSHPTANTALHLGSVYLKLTELSKAEASFRQALQLEPNSPKRDEIRKLIVGIAARNVGVVELTSTPTGATVSVEGSGTRVMGKTPLSLTLPPGTHRVMVAREGHRTAAQEVKVTFGETVTLALTLVALPAATLPSAGVSAVAAPAVPVEPPFRSSAPPPPVTRPVEVRPTPGNRHALKAALVLTSFAVLTEALALVVHFQGESLVPGSLDYQRTHNIELGFHITAGALAAGAIVGYIVEFAPGRSAAPQNDGRIGSLGMAPLPQGGAQLLSGRF